MLKYQRIILKISGEALAGEKKLGLDYDKINEISAQIVALKNVGCEIGIVVGGGNFIRGHEAEKSGMDRPTADYIGMMGTIMNALALQAALEKLNAPTRVQTAISVQQVAEPYIRRKALRHLEKDRIVIFGAGTGSPFFSTDTTAVLKACEIKATAVLMAKNGVNGVYDKDPHKFDDAKKYDYLTYKSIIEKNLQVMDSTAATMAEDNNIEILVFDMNEKDSIKRAMTEKIDCTIINNGVKK